MHPRLSGHVGRAFLVVATIFALSAPQAAWAGGGGRGGPVFHAGGGFHAPAMGYHGLSGAGFMRFGHNALPPVAGIIHERPGMAPYISAYGHTNTAAHFGGFAPRPGYGHTNTGAGWGGFGPAGFDHAAGGVRFGGAPYGSYGHVGTALRGFGFGRPGFAARGAGRYGDRLAFRDRLRLASSRGRFGYGGGAEGGGFGGYGDGGYGGAYGGPAGTLPAAGTSPPAGTYGSYGGGSYGGYGGSYASETPLSARFAEPPLAPSPGAPYGPNDSYAYAASEDVGPGPRIISVRRGAGCGCSPRARVEPVVYRYGVGTAY